MAKNYIAEGKRLTYNNAGAALVSGQAVAVSAHLIAVALVDIPTGGSGAVAVDGVFALPKAAEALALGERIYWDADGDPVGGVAGSGALTATATGNIPAGVVYRAASESAVTVDCKLGAPWTSVATTAAAVAITDAGGHFSAEQVEATLQEVGAHLHSASHSILIPLAALSLEDGTAITKFADGASPTPGFSQEGGKELVLRWNNHATPAKVAVTLPLPPTLDDSAGISLRAIAAMSGATDTPVLEFEAYFNAADDDCAGTDPEVTGGATRAVYACAVAAADVPAAPGTLTVILGPKAGELGTDDLLLAGLQINYTGKTLS